MKRLTLFMLVALLPLLTMSQKRSKKDKSNKNTTALTSSYEFMTIIGYQLMAPIPEGMSDELSGPNGAEIQAKLNVSSYMESRTIISFDLSRDKTEYEELSSGQYKSISEAVNRAAEYGWDFVSANVISDGKLKIHYFYMTRKK
jgi:hypothetical protein